MKRRTTFACMLAAGATAAKPQEAPAQAPPTAETVRAPRLTPTPTDMLTPPPEASPQPEEPPDPTAAPTGSEAAAETEPEPFHSGLSGAERECLPPGSTSCAGTIRVLESGEARLSQVMGCLTEENQFALFLALNHATPAELIPEGQECMWRGHRPLVFMTQEEPGRDEYAFGRLMAAALMAPGAITAHCLSDEEFEALDGPLKQEPEQRELTRCLVGRAGGIGEFVRWLIEDEAPPGATRPGYEECTQRTAGP